ncbi:hypothetical protein [Porphyrobacter sp. CACIAM 03H1]|uniref:hypothetical protein n=1 Tax=Porphyrobacter sp. CACIAM 03H1 TaxID=2003315 RepID=UPI0012FDA72B|nr:hypothetical protein [Porphyrobacter sp. CACIAM 03H1]
MEGYIKFCRRLTLVGLGVAVGIIAASEPNVSFVVSTNMKYTDLVAVILTALGVILAALAAVIGLLAYINWQRFENNVQIKVEEYLNNFVKPTERYEAIRDLIEDHKEKTRRLLEAEKEIENLSKFDENQI